MNSLWLPIGEKFLSLSDQEKNILETFDCISVQAKNSVFQGTSIAY